jgi:xanthine dehydrogenase accessory factor
MNDWLGAAANLPESEPAVLVTVALVEGSGPREPGAKMLVTRARQFDTIGGGHLEMRAVEISRAMLRGEGPSRRVERFALGPSLGQCCGGVVHLAFERVDGDLPAVLAALHEHRNRDCWRVSSIDGAPTSILLDAFGERIAGSDAGSEPACVGEPATRPIRDADGNRWLVDVCRAPRAHLTLFGAGHVGAAIVRALADLPCRVTWVDERAEQFPPEVPANVRVEACDAPEALVAAAPPGGSFLVMTHQHALDLRLTEAILARGDAGWFGLIGSQTKRRQFEHRLRARGIAPERIAAMVCPIGLPGIAGKAPAVIAASVCAQLLIAWEAAERDGERDDKHTRLVSCRAAPQQASPQR